MPIISRFFGIIIRMFFNEPDMASSSTNNLTVSSAFLRPAASPTFTTP